MIEKMFDLKIVAIGHFVSRSGTIFIHSLLDNHPEVITVPATIDIAHLLVDKKLSVKEYYEIFEKYNPKFFDTSKFTQKDKHNSKLWSLGENKNEKIITNKSDFKNYFFQILKNKNINPENILKTIYLSYSLCHNKDISKGKIFLFHPHEKKITLRFDKFFKKTRYIIPVRNPIKVYESIIRQVKTITKVRGENYYPSGQLIESALDIDDFYKNNLNMYFIKMEDFNKNLEEEVIKLSKYLDIKFKTSMLESTFGGLKYWGNDASKDNKDFKRMIHNEFSDLPRNDLIFLNLINKEYLIALNYKQIRVTFIEKILIPFILFRPLKDEIEFLKKINLRDFAIYVKYLSYYLPKRIYLIYIIIKNKFSKRYRYLKEKINCKNS